MVLYAVKAYVPDARLGRVNIAPPEEIPSVAIYHPDAPRSFSRLTNTGRGTRDVPVACPMSNVQGPSKRRLNPDSTIGLLLMRPQVVSKTTRHYDALIRAIEAEGLSVIPALSTLMDNREACERFFLATGDGRQETAEDGAYGWHAPNSTNSRVSQIVSLTGFSFVGGPAMNDSEAAAEFLQKLNRPYRSAVSLDTQTIDAWLDSQTGLNPVQSGMQIAIPEIDGATEPFIYGGIPAAGVEPVALEERCIRFARRLRRWNRLRTAPRHELKNRAGAVLLSTKQRKHRNGSRPGCLSQRLGHASET